MITDYSKFRMVNRLNYFAFDWDDNILHMPTKIQMDKIVEGKWIPIEITPAEFAKYRNDSKYRIRNNNPIESFIEFKDIGPRGEQAFIKDVIYAVDNGHKGTSWDDYIRCLTEASLFAIITARGHEYDTIKQGPKYIIDNCLTKEQQDIMYQNCLEYASIFEKGKEFHRKKGKFSDNELIKLYLESCRYYGVGAPYSESFKNDFGVAENTPIEECKQIALGRFIEICNTYGKNANLGVSIGFSDDDKKNVESIKKYFEEKSNTHINLRFSVFDTSTKDVNRTKFIKGIKEDMGSDLGNRQANLLRFDSFNSQANTLTNSTNDFTGFNNAQKVKIASKLYKNILLKKSRKAKNKVKKKRDE